MWPKNSQVPGQIQCLVAIGTLAEQHLRRGAGRTKNRRARRNERLGPLVVPLQGGDRRNRWQWSLIPAKNQIDGGLAMPPGR
jgi:hypothetical protein